MGPQTTHRNASGSYRISVVTIAFMALGGCASLPDIASDQCGNGVVDAHEDCDTFLPKGSSPNLQCGAVGTELACRFVASTADACPSGKTPAYVRGIDDVCRQSTDRFRASFALPSILGNRAEIADFDANGVGDLTLVPSDRSLREIDYMTGSGIKATIDLAANQFQTVAITDFDGSSPSAADVVGPTTEGLTTLLGLPDGSFFPKLYSQIDPSRVYSFASPAVLRGGAAPLDGLGAVRKTGPSLVACLDALGSDGVSCLGDVLPLGKAPDSYTPEKATVVFGPLNGTGELPVFVFGAEGGSSIEVETWTGPAAHHRTSLTFPVNGAELSKSVSLADVDGDGTLDVVASATWANHTASSIFFFPGPSGAWLKPTETMVELIPNLQGDELLAAGKLNDDPFADFILLDGIIVTVPQLPANGQGPSFVGESGASDGGLWTEAVIGDLNGDGIGDAVMASTNPGLDIFFGGHGAAITRGRLSSDAALKTLALGDLDGDGSTDLVASSVDHPSCDADQELVGYYGASLARPQGPVRLAEAPAIRQVVSLLFGGADGKTGDAMADLAVLYGQAASDGASCSQDTGGATLLLGASDRQLRSPYVFIAPPTGPGPETTLPVRAVVGDVNGDGMLDIASTALTINSKSKKVRNGIFVIRGTGNANLDPLASAYVAQDDSKQYLDYFGALAIGGAATAGMRDLVFFDPLYAPSCVVGPACDLTLSVRHLEWDGSSYQASDVTVPGDATVAASIDPSTYIEPAKIIAVDADSDGDLDFFASLSVPQKELPQGPDGKPLSATYLLRNDAGTLSAVRVPLPGGQPVVDFAIAKDSALHAHILLATPKGVFAYENSGTRLLFEPGSAALSSGPASVGSEARVTSIATGDVTGDDLEDLVVVTTAGTVVLARMAAVDRGTASFSLNASDALTSAP